MKRKLLNCTDPEEMIKILRKRRQRRKLLPLFYIVLIISVLFTITVFASQTRSKSPITYTHVVIEKGDTLWDFARKYYPNKDVRNGVWEIKRINNLSSSTIYEGQVLKVPDIIDKDGN